MQISSISLAVMPSTLGSMRVFKEGEGPVFETTGYCAYLIIQSLNIHCETKKMASFNLSPNKN